MSAMPKSNNKMPTSTNNMSRRMSVTVGLSLAVVTGFNAAHSTNSVASPSLASSSRSSADSAVGSTVTAVSAVQLRSDKQPYWEQESQKNTAKIQKKSKKPRGPDTKFSPDVEPVGDITSDHKLFWDQNQLTHLGETAEKWVQRMEKLNAIVKEKGFPGQKKKEEDKKEDHEDQNQSLGEKQNQESQNQENQNPEAMQNQDIIPSLSFPVQDPKYGNSLAVLVDSHFGGFQHDERKLLEALRTNGFSFEGADVMTVTLTHPQTGEQWGYVTLERREVDSEVFSRLHLEGSLQEEKVRLEKEKVREEEKVSEVAGNSETVNPVSQSKLLKLSKVSSKSKEIKKNSTKSSKKAKSLKVRISPESNNSEGEPRSGATSPTNQDFEPSMHASQMGDDNSDIADIEIPGGSQSVLKPGSQPLIAAKKIEADIVPAVVSNSQAAKVPADTTPTFGKKPRKFKKPKNKISIQQPKPSNQNLFAVEKVAPFEGPAPSLFKTVSEIALNPEIIVPQLNVSSKEKRFQDQKVLFLQFLNIAHKNKFLPTFVASVADGGCGLRLDCDLMGSSGKPLHALPVAEQKEILDFIENHLPFDERGNTIGDGHFRQSSRNLSQAVFTDYTNLNKFSKSEVFSHMIHKTPMVDSLDLVFNGYDYRKAIVAEFVLEKARQGELLVEGESQEKVIKSLTDVNVNDSHVKVGNPEFLLQLPELLTEAVNESRLSRALEEYHLLDLDQDERIEELAAEFTDQPGVINVAEVFSERRLGIFLKKVFGLKSLKTEKARGSTGNPYSQDPSDLAFEHSVRVFGSKEESINNNENREQNDQEMTSMESMPVNNGQKNNGKQSGEDRHMEDGEENQEENQGFSNDDIMAMFKQPKLKE